MNLKKNVLLKVAACGLAALGLLMLSTAGSDYLFIKAIDGQREDAIVLHHKYYNFLKLRREGKNEEAFEAYVSLRDGRSVIDDYLALALLKGMMIEQLSKEKFGEVRYDHRNPEFENNLSVDAVKKMVAYGVKGVDKGYEAEKRVASLCLSFSIICNAYSAFYAMPEVLERTHQKVIKIRYELENEKELQKYVSLYYF